ncbi:hypothetical protein ACFYRD_28660 [Streptomyces hirsutus]|uniref:hypothetical protein n=1 Tax=Streptomyces hirsutus TaxID=35620 RepID=UPI00367EC171
MKSVRSSAVAVVALLLVTGCSDRPGADQAEGDACPPAASSASPGPTPASGPARHVELGAVRCSDADSGMSAVDITVKNTGTGEANYYVTVEFIDSEQRSLATEYTYIDHVVAAATKSRTAYVGPPADGRGLAVRLVEVKREAVPTKAPATAPSAALDTAVELFVDQGLVPAGTPYGDCPDTAPQAYWIGDRGNCWVAVPTLPPLPATSSPTQPGLAAPTPTPVLPGTLCRDGWVSRSSGRGTCSHHGGIAR